MLYIRFSMKVIALVLFCLSSAYVLLFGKKETGIKLDYVMASIAFWAVMIII